MSESCARWRVWGISGKSKLLKDSYNAQWFLAEVLEGITTLKNVGLGLGDGSVDKV